MKKRRLTLRPDQLKHVRKIEHFKGRALIANQMRTGKTIITLQWLYETQRKVFPALVVCPEIGKLHWEEKALFHYNIRGSVLNGETPLVKKKSLIISKLYIINWEILQYWEEFLLSIGIKTLVGDEIHYAKNPDNYCSKSAIHIGRKSKYVLGLSGTPAKSRPAELFTILNLIRPDVFSSRTIYNWRYCEPKIGMKGKWEFKGAKHLDELYLLLKKHLLIRCTRKEVFGQDEKDRKIITIKLKGKKRKEYDEAETDIIKWLTKQSPARAYRAKKVKRLIRIGYLKRLASELKMQKALKWIDRYLEKHKNQKVAIFGIHRNILKQLKDKYKKISVSVDGNIRGKKRKLAVDTFQNNKNCKIFIGQTRAAGTVIELSKAKAAIGLEFDWTPGDVNQWEDRIFEQGSTEALKIFHIVAEDTIEERLCEILQDKQETLSMMFDGVPDREPLNVYDLLEKELLKKRNKL